MSSEPPPSRFEEDLPFNEEPGGPDRYRDWTEKPVRHFTVVAKADGKVLGYLWAGDEDGAAAFEARVAAGPDAFNEGIVWIGLLRDAKSRGLTPSQALAELYAAEPGGRGRPLAGSLTDAPGAAIVDALAKGQ